jgi:8-oxo-dGTP diphosphatase
VRAAAHGQAHVGRTPTERPETWAGRCRADTAALRAGQDVGTEMLMLPGACAVVVDDRGHVLLGRRADTGEWALPAGAIDPGEQPAEAAIREVYEETGVHVVVERLAGVAVREPVTYPNGDICQYLTVWFRCPVIGGHAVVNDEESTAVGWFSPTSCPAWMWSTGCALILLLTTMRRPGSPSPGRTMTGSRLGPDQGESACPA